MIEQEQSREEPAADFAHLEGSPLLSSELSDADRFAKGLEDLTQRTLLAQRAFDEAQDSRSRAEAAETLENLCAELKWLSEKGVAGLRAYSLIAILAEDPSDSITATQFRGMDHPLVDKLEWLPADELSLGDISFHDDIHESQIKPLTQQPLNQSYNGNYKQNLKQEISIEKLNLLSEPSISQSELYIHEESIRKLLEHSEFSLSTKESLASESKHTFLPLSQEQDDD